MIQTNYLDFELDKEKKIELNKKMTSLVEFCQGNKIPVFVTVAISNSDKKTEYESIVYENMSHDLELKDDQIKKHVLIARGFEAVPPRDSLTINLAEVLNGNAE